MNIAVKEFNKQELLSSLEDTTREVVESLSLFNEDELNMVPYEGSWTAGQVGEHLLMSNPGISKIISGNTQPTERPADENVEILKLIFLDFTKKAISAKAIWPSDMPKEKEKLIPDLKKTMDEIKSKAGSMDLSLTCLDFPFPTLGEFTRWEWVTFIIYHTKKHLYQIKNIYKKIKDEA